MESYNKTTVVKGCKNFTVEMECYKARIPRGRGQTALVTTATTSDASG